MFVEKITPAAQAAPAQIQRFSSPTRPCGRRRRVAGRSAVLAAAGAVAVLAGPASGQTELAVTEWVEPGNGDWFEPSNWSAGLPGDLTAGRIDNGGTAVIGQSGAVAAQLRLASEDGTSGNVLMTGGDLTLPDKGLGFTIAGEDDGEEIGQFTIDELVVGQLGTASWTQSGGTVNANVLHVGRDVTGVGTMSLSAGTVNVRDFMFLGDLAGGNGTLAQTGGTLNFNGEGESSSGDFIVGGGGTGTYTKNAGSLAADNVEVGRLAGGSGTFVHSGGTTLVNGQTIVARDGEGSFTLEGGSYTTQRYVIGRNPGALATVSHAGGTMTVSRDLGTVGDRGRMWVGFTGQAALSHTGGTIDVGERLYVGLNAGSQGAYTLSDADPGDGDGDVPTLNVANFIAIGQNGANLTADNANGTFTQTGGVVNVGTSGVGGNLFVGAVGTGTYNLGGGELNVPGRVALADRAEAVGRVTVSGGTATIGETLFVGPQGEGGYTQSGGDVSVGGDLLLATVRDDADASVAISGGTFDVAGGATLGRASSTGTVDFTVQGSAGEITIGGQLLANAVADFTFLLDSGGVSLIDVAGSALLEGVGIDLGGARPMSGNTVDLITATTFGSSTFVLDSSDADSYDLEVVAGGNGEILRAILTRLLGDANNDGSVTIADFAILRANFGTSGSSFEMGDFNEDGSVTIADFAILRANFGTSVSSAELAEADAWAASVPEPATLGLLAAAGLGLVRRR